MNVGGKIVFVPRTPFKSNLVLAGKAVTNSIEALFSNKILIIALFVNLYRWN